MFKLSKISYSKLNVSTVKTSEIGSAIQKIDALSINKKINVNYFDKNTLNRIGLSSSQFLRDLFKNLTDYGLDDKHIAKTLKLYEDWSLLSRENLAKSSELFRSTSYFKPELFPVVFSSDKCLLKYDQKKLLLRLNDLKEFFTKKQLNQIMLKTPSILSNNLDLIRYKFTYVYILMGIQQDEMILTRMFDHSIEHIRERHLFLERSSFYVRPNKKGISKIENPRLYNILDSNLKQYLKLCAKSSFDEIDYHTFCEYLKEENFDNELLGNRICKSFREQIIQNIKITYRETKLKEQSDLDY
jgi:hypothetical protein